MTFNFFPWSYQAEMDTGRLKVRLEDAGPETLREVDSALEALWDLAVQMKRKVGVRGGSLLHGAEWSSYEEQGKKNQRKITPLVKKALVEFRRIADALGDSAVFKFVP